MKRREFVKSVFGGSVALTMARREATLAPEPRKPNILVIVADDLGYADVGFHGCQEIPTPNIDALARNGVRFTNGYVSHPWCAPTRAGIMTGRYQQRFGFEHNPRYDPTDELAGLPESEITLAQCLKKVGYVCGIVGKWHLGAHPKFHPIKRGFDEFFGFRGGGHDYFKSDSKLKAPFANGRMYQLPLERNFEEWLPLDGYLTFVLAEQAVQFIRRHRDNPFFLYLAFNAPHTPLQAPEAYVQRFQSIADPKRRVYAAMVSALDEAIGQVLKALRETHLEEQTIVFFISDNGGPTEANGSSNAPLRGGKGGLYEGGIRVPFVIQWKGKVPAGKVCEHPVICLDIFATAVEAAGAPFPDDRKIDGVNLLPFLQGAKDASPHEFLFWRIGGGSWLAVRDERYKLHRRKDGAVELYDLHADIGEQRNLAKDLPTVVQRLNKVLDEWNAQLSPPIVPPPRKGEPT